MAEPGKDRDPAPSNPWTAAYEYAVDAWQRGVLYADVMRQRGNQYHQHMAKRAPNVLSMEYELVLDGREFPARSTTACYASRRPRASKPTRSSAPSWWSTRAPATAPASAASSRKARSAWRCAQGMPATSPPSCPSPCRPKRSRT